MLKRHSYLDLIYLCLISLVIQACNAHSDKLPNSSNSKTIKEPTEDVKDHDIRNSNIHKRFKIDSSDFDISASETSWLIAMEPNKSFKSQLHKIKQTMKQISETYDLEHLKSVSIQPLNKELLANIAAVPTIQSELQAKKKAGIVNSMGVISPEAHKATHIKELTQLFLKYKLKPHQFYIDKCVGIRTASDTVIRSMFCASINFKLTKASALIP